MPLISWLMKYLDSVGKGHAVNGMSLPTMLRYLVFKLFMTIGSYVNIGLCFKTLFGRDRELCEHCLLKRYLAKAVTYVSTVYYWVSWRPVYANPR